MSNPHRFAFTDRGIVPHGTDLPYVGDTVIAAGAALEASQAAEVIQLPTPTPVAPKPAASGISPKTVIAAAKARVKEIKAELKHHRALQKELAQLENLLKAARKPTHLAAVRQLSSSRI